MGKVDRMKCKHHGPAAPGVWACPTCLVELREENTRLRASLLATVQLHTSALESAHKESARLDWLLQFGSRDFDGAPGWKARLRGFIDTAMAAAPKRSCEQGCNGCDECTDYEGRRENE